MSKPSVKYKLLYTKSTLKDIQKLDLVAKKKIKKKIELYSQRPFFYARVSHFLQKPPRTVTRRGSSEVKSVVIPPPSEECFAHLGGVLTRVRNSCYARKLIKPSLGSYCWRIGNYRVIFDIKGKTIIILRIGHRKEIYR